MKTILKLTTIQAPLAWEDIDTNLAYFSKKIESLANQTHLIVLPEMFTTGFSMNAKTLAETMDGKTMQWLSQTATQTKIAICGSFIAKEKDCFYNRFVFMKPDGTYSIYDKRHLFTLAKEDKIYTAGTARIIIKYRGWKICPQICYDLRFPVWSRNIEQYDLLIYVANFPAKRAHAWRSLLVARAIENQCFVAGVNRIGKDGQQIEYSGDSLVLDFNGMPLFDAQSQESVQTTRLDYLRKANFRDRFQFLEDRDSFKIK